MGVPLRGNEDEGSVVVADVLGEVHVGLDTLSLDVGEGTAENRDVVVTLKLEGKVFARVGEVGATPLKRSVVVSNVVVEVELRVNHFAILVGALAHQDVAVLELNVLGAHVEVDHDDGGMCMER
jgi:hypothetical protein